jgi:hypothetical protein
MMARFEIGDVLLTTRISEILLEVCLAVVAWNSTLTNEFSE